MANTIKFSHKYPKLWSQSKGKLIYIRIIDAKDVNDSLKEYDTSYDNGDGYLGYYELPKEGKLIQLVFLGDLGIPFCTLRRHTPMKEVYYKSGMNKDFEIRITEKGDEQCRTGNIY